MRRSAFLSVIAAVAMTAATLIAAPTMATAADPVGPGTYEEHSPALVYKSSWTRLASSGSSDGAIRYSSSTTASASLTFSGSWITWYTWKSSSAGIVKVAIDGETVATVDNYASATKTGVIGYSAAVTPGTHTITVSASGSKNARSSSRITHLDSFVVGAAHPVPDPASLSIPRASDCPAATVTVRNAAELTAALAGAGPGTAIHLADGTYLGRFLLTASGTPEQPIWLCGTRSAVLETGTQAQGTALRIEGAENVRVAGITIARSLQGIMVKLSQNIAITDTVVTEMGYEGIHFYAFTTDSTIAYNLISRTGLVDKSYGEGVYIGTSQRRWAEVTGGHPDRSDRNTIVGNAIEYTGAESIDAKEGTSGGVIVGNAFEGHPVGSNAEAWALVTGSDWTVAHNEGTLAREHGFKSVAWGDWGYDNAFFANSASGGTGYGLFVHDKSRGVEISCDNVVTGATSGFTNVFCTP